MRRTGWIVAPLVTAAFIVGACSGDNKVGEGVDLGFEQQAGERLGERKKEEAPKEAATTRPPQETTTTPPPTPAPAPTTAPPPPKPSGSEVALEIRITADQSGKSQFDPSAARIFEGTCVRFINTDSQPRSAAADDGSWESPMLSPGQDWVLCPDDARRYNYHDGTRPYAVAFLEVLAR